MENLHEEIEKLSGSEAKSLLLNILYRIKFMSKSKDSQSEIVKELFSLYDEIQDGQQSKKPFEKEYKAVHIVSGESPAGSLRAGLGHGNKVIGFPDFFGHGPIWMLHTGEGRARRFEWLKDHLNVEMDYMEEEYESRISKTLAEIEAIPDDLPIVLWTADNADEQTAMRYFFHLLREKKNDIYLVNSTSAYKEMFAEEDPQHILRHSGEGAPEKFREIYKTKLGKPLSNEEKSRLQNEWIHLSNTDEVLRIWKNGRIQDAAEDYFDSAIVDTVKELHAENDTHDFILAGRVIGEILFRSEQLVSDTFLEYRLRSLVYDGTFEIKGIPKSMRHYRVKLN